MNDKYYNEFGDECTRNDVQTVLEDMRQYFIDRDLFRKTVNNAINYATLIDAFNYGEFNQGYYFAWFRYEDEYYILHKPSGMMINWYKHLGRTNTCNQSFRTVEDIREFFILFAEDLKEWANENNIKLD